PAHHPVARQASWHRSVDKSGYQPSPQAQAGYWSPLGELLQFSGLSVSVPEGLRGAHMSILRHWFANPWSFCLLALLPILGIVSLWALRRRRRALAQLGSLLALRAL